jgi:phosphate:Na+ symporter
LNFTLANEAVSPASIAVIHTIFNFATVALLLPFTKLIAKLAQKLIKEKAADENAPKRATYLDERLFNSPAVAIMECDNYTTKMALLAKETVEKAMKLLTDYDEEIAKEIVECEDTLDMYEDELGTYLVKLSTLSLTAEDSHKISRMLHSIGDFERLGDHALNLKKTAQEIHEKNVVFSEEAVKEINVLISAISEIIIMTTNVYEKNDVKGANKIEPLEQVIDKLTAKIKSNHISRLQQGDCTIEMGFVLSDLITNCERISDHCSNIGIAVIEGQSDGFDPHQYLNNMKNENEEFKALYSEYKEKYAV